MRANSVLGESAVHNYYKKKDTEPKLQQRTRKLVKMSKKIVVFAPHPDDETWGCGGTIAKKIREGYEVLIVVITDGRHLFRSVGIDRDPTPEEVKKIRREEVLRAIKVLGASRNNLVFLDFEDGALEKYEKEVEERIIEILREYSPAEVFFPYIKDGHPDHRVTNRVVKRCLQRLGLKPIQYQYSIAHKHAYIGPVIERLLSLIRQHKIKIDISEFLDIKEKAVKEFKYEISIISSQQKKPIEKNLGRYLKNREIFYICK